MYRHVTFPALFLPLSVYMDASTGQSVHIKKEKKLVLDSSRFSIMRSYEVKVA